MPRPFCPDPLGPSWPTLSTITDFWDILRHDETANSTDTSIIRLMAPTCSEETLFVWIPSLLLGIMTAIEMHTLQMQQIAIRAAINNGIGHGRASKRPTTDESIMPLTAFHLTKMFTAAFIIATLLCRLTYWTIFADNVLYHVRINDVIWRDSSAPVLADALRLVSFILILYLFFIHRRYQVHSSAAIFIYLTLNVVPNIYTLTTLLTEFFYSESQSSLFESPFTVLNQPFMLTTKLLYIFALGFLFIIYCFSDRDAVWSSSGSGSLRNKLLSPELSASFFSKLSFAWFTSLIIKARRVTSLQQEHLWMLAAKDSAQAVISPFERLYERRRLRAAATGSQLNVITLLVCHYWPQLLVIAAIKLIASLFIFVNPVVLDMIIGFMDPASTEPAWRGYFYCSLMFFSPMFESFFTSQYEYHINVITMRMKTCLTSIIYSKSLRLSNAAKQQFTTGEIVNFIAVDLQRIVDFFNNLNTAWSSPVQIALGVYLLWLQLSYAAFAGFSCMLIIIPINLWLTDVVKRMQMAMMAEKDRRSKLIDEILNGIKVVKLNAWEDFFERHVMSYRRKEVHHLKRLAYTNAVINSLFSGSAFLVGLFSFFTFTMLSPSNILNANKAFVSLALFNIIRIPLAFLPILLSFAGVAIVSIRRINEYLNAPEIDPNATSHLQYEPLSPEMAPASPEARSVIKIIDGTFTWLPEDGQATLHRISCDIKSGQLVALVGGVGCGKSSLLSAVLGEMIKLNGSVEIRGKVAFVPQEAWIRNATIRENIILDKVFDEKRYKTVIENCALGLDLAMFAAGDLTEVGEKGINLSGGQKQRISIARSVYNGADTFLFDDPLSALDAHVSKHIFEKVIGPNGCLQGQARLLVTHKLSLLSQVDQIIYLSRGQIEETGSFAQLIAAKGPFSEYVAEYFLDKATVAATTGELDEEELEFMNSVEPQLKNVIEKLELSRSTSVSRQISSHSGSSHRRQSEKSLSRKSTQRSAARSISTLDSNQSAVSVIRQTTSTAGKLTQVEGMAEGSVDISNHKKYFAAIGFCACFGILLALALSNVFQVFGSLWLSEWSNDALNPEVVNDSAQRDRRIIVYAVLGIFEVTLAFIGTLAINLVCVNAARVLHNEMLSSILRVPMQFFDTQPMGRIMNRFSRDIDVIDLQISLNLRLLSMQIFRTMVAFGLISLEAPVILALLIPMAIIYYLVQRLYINTSRQLKRIEAVTRSPINNLLSETVSGATSIRTYGLVERFVREVRRRIDDNNQSYWLNFAASRWLAIRLEFLSYSIVFISTLFAVSSRGTLTPGIAGLAISYSLNITSILNIFIRGYTDLETNFVSVERVVEYMEVPQETDSSQPEQQQLLAPPENWPSKGAITYRNYSTQYRAGLKLCLKRLNLAIAPGTKLAIVGRTGSGKSSLALSLFRILEPVEGQILIDDLDITSINRKLLRRALTIVAQDPVLFTGTLRANVDLYGQHSDEEVYEALKLVNLEAFLETIDYNLQYPISNASENLSSGQRQLLCLARALIRNRKVVVFDEATALVDYETDQSIHNVIFSERFKPVTVLMIAHRLDHILEYDQVLVMKNGEVAEFDDPRRLVENQQSDFYSMAKEAKII